MLNKSSLLFIGLGLISLTSLCTFLYFKPKKNTKKDDVDTSDGCKSLGGHYNPLNNTHGSFSLPEHPRHAGDLINNFKTDKNGSFHFQYEDETITLFSEDTILGRSVVIHKDSDDLGLGVGNKRKESLISGNAGKRIVCGVIGLKAN